MATPANTIERYSLANNGDKVREDLTDVVYNIAPTEVPFMSNIGRGVAESDFTEWPIDTLRAADPNNAQLDGDVFTTDARTDGARIGTYLQISWVDIEVSRRANLVRKAGRRSELAYQIAKASRELRTDLEARFLSTSPCVPGANATAPETAGLGAWIGAINDATYERDAGYVSRGATGADGTLSGAGSASGYPNAGPTDGTLRALTEAGLLGVVKAMYVNGADPSIILCGPTVKQRISNYMFTSNARIATQYQDHGGSKRDGLGVVGAVDVYVSDFSVLDIVPDRFVRATEREVYVIDPSMLEVRYLDGFHPETISKAGDTERRRVLVDYALCVKSPVAHGVFADVDSSAAMAP